MNASSVVARDGKTLATRKKHLKVVEECRAQLEMLGVELDTIVVAPAEYVAPAAKSSGSAKDWDIEVVDPAKFMRWVLNKGKKPILDLDLTISFKLGAVKNYIKTTDTTSIPGLSIKPKKRIAALKGVSK